MPLSTGTQLGPYRIVSLIGSGGMGVVYAARDERLDREVAIKILNSTAPGEGDSRFWREARAAAALNHPNICQVYDNPRSGGPAIHCHGIAGGRTVIRAHATWGGAACRSHPDGFGFSQGWRRCTRDLSYIEISSQVTFF